MKIEHYEQTDVGKIRANNQDSFGLSESDGIYIVADGMGGGAAGDFASQFAVEIILKAYKSIGALDVRNINGENEYSFFQESSRLLAAIKLANRALSNYADKYPRLSGMGTTLSAILFEKKRGIVHIFNVGDSRVYRMRGGRLEQLTRDHTKISELIESGKMRREDVKNAEIQSMLTRALGTKVNVKVDYRVEYVKPNDFYLICSDGINGELDDSAIRDIISINKDSVEIVVHELINAANNVGGKDNSTVAAVKIESEELPKADLGLLKVESTVTVDEETFEQSLFEDKVLKKILPKLKIRIPEEAKERNFAKNPVYLGTIFALVILGITFFYANSKKPVSDKTLTDLTGKVTGLSLEIRTPIKAQIAEFEKAPDQVTRLQLIQDWQKNKNTLTSPISDVFVTVKGQAEEEFGGISGMNPLDIQLDKGNHEIGLKYPGYKIITDKMELKESLAVSLEYGESFKSVVVIMVPEKIIRKEK